MRILPARRRDVQPATKHFELIDATADGGALLHIGGIIPPGMYLYPGDRLELDCMVHIRAERENDE
jgi:hypothetical protein